MTGLREPLPTRVQDTPPLPETYDRAVRGGLDDLGLDLTPDARDAIDGHVRLLLAWTGAVNLTAVRDPLAVATAHVVDSLTAVPWLRAHGIERFVDVGSGGGLPGIPLAAALPAAGARLVESIGKKARFLETVVAAIGLEDRVTVDARRVEALAADRAERGRWPAVTVRAVAPMAELVELAFPLLEPGGRLVAWKRGDLTAELRATRAAIEALGGGTLDVQPVPVVALAGHVLVVVTRTGPVPDAYPRDAAQRRRRPW